MSAGRSILARIFLGAIFAAAGLVAAGPSWLAGGTGASAASCPANSGGPVERATAVADVEVGGCAGYLVVSASGQVSAFGTPAELTSF